VAYLLPEAILALKQGVGRLIRAETDRGVMAILDSRVNTKRYGPRVIDSLPPARQTLQFEDVVAFFENED
jgi:ATP-dependent DNA helicase DinG